MKEKLISLIPYVSLAITLILIIAVSSQGFMPGTGGFMPGTG